MESIFNYVKRRLLDVGPPEWEAISRATGSAKSVPRKFAYERDNAHANKVEPLYRYFLLRDYGLKKLPHENGPITKSGR
jgi:hypothetical protein